MGEPTKTCCTCHDEKPLSEFNRYAKSRDGRQPRCRACQRDKRIDWYAENREREIAKSAAWNAENPERIRKNARARYAKDPEKYLSAWRRSYAKHGKRWKAREAAQRRLDAERYREQERLWRLANKESIAERKRRYRDTNPNVRWQEKANTHRRRAMTSGGPSGEQIAARMAYLGDSCWICGQVATAIDHVKPLAKGGPHLLANLRPSCAFCNSRKRDRWLGVSRLAELQAWVNLHAKSA